jgi:biopolymer transport protein ExbB
MSQLNRPRIAIRLFVALCLGTMLWGAIAFTRSTFAADSPAKAEAKQPADKSTGKDSADKKADQALAASETESATKFEKKSTPAAPPMKSINWFDMIWNGGPLMIPIGIMSVLVVAFAIERAIGLRRKKVIPRRLVTSLGAMAASPAGFDPRKAYRLCQQYPSSASNVVRAMLLKVGRPTEEVERAVSESIARESWRLNYNVRPLVLAVTVTPLFGLLGTVLGMIIVFFNTANAPIGQDRAVLLAGGIYLKLVTTLSGLAVAVPALVLAHYFEGRIQALMREVEDLVQGILPQVEKYEGKLRVARQSAGAEPPPVLETVAEAGK